MLPKSKRLRTIDFKGFRGTRTLHTPHFFLRYGAAPGGAKAAAVVSLATARTAVSRNLLRRRIYATVAQWVKNNGVRAHLVVNAKKGADALSFADIEHELRQALQKVR